MLLCALFIRISVRFCDIRTPPPPLHNLFFSKMLWHQRCFPVQFEQSLQTRCIKAVFG